MSNRFTNVADRIMDATLWISLVAVFCMLLKSEASFNPVTVTSQLDLPKIEESPTRNWGINYPVNNRDIETAVRCMALNIYFEARSESIKAQYAVADVVMHRVAHSNYPDTICGVIYDGVYPKWNLKMPYKWRCSFTWHCDRKSDIPRDEDALKIAKYIARDVIMNPTYEPVVRYALYYHATTVSPFWKTFKVFVGQVGAHLFYI